jgi:hypothetical protein
LRWEDGSKKKHKRKKKKKERKKKHNGGSASRPRWAEGRRAKNDSHDRADRVGNDRDRAKAGALAQSPFLKIEASKFTEVG